MKTPRQYASFLAIVLVTSVAAASAGCASTGNSSVAANQSHQTVLRVRNNHWHDVRIYVIADDGRTPVRVGSVMGMSSTVLQLRNHYIGHGTRLMIEPIGARTRHITDIVEVRPGSEMSLTVGTSLRHTRLVTRQRR